VKFWIHETAPSLDSAHLRLLGRRFKEVSVTRRSRWRPQRVIIIGASVAGLFAAAAASGDGRHVTVLERDELPDVAGPRRGVPQGRQPHVFLYRGLLAVEELLPGLREELLSRGAVPLDTGDLAWLGEFGWSPWGRPSFEVLSATRPLFEHTLLRRVRSLPGVEVRGGARVESVASSGDAGQPAWEVQLDDGSHEMADLLIDASGRGSRLPTWLAAAGLPSVEISEVDAHVGYATRAYRLDHDRVTVAGVVLLQTPDPTPGGIALPVEDGRWLVGAVGAGQLRPPRDAEAFDAFLEGLRDPALSELTRKAEPVGDVAVHRQTANRRHHYEKVRDWPPGLLVIGDALCAFNPVYGQGITVAACEALVLRGALARGLRRGDERRLLRKFCSVAALPWAIASGEDLRYPTSSGTQPVTQALLGRWTRELARLAIHGDVRANDTLNRVYHLMGSPALLFQPALIASAVRARLLGRGPTTERPPIFADG
jgi:2-polyprenyl-6-methoxyphenol hydroxylase-like FAD-dependent oxidoreductase